MCIIISEEEEELLGWGKAAQAGKVFLPTLQFLAPGDAQVFCAGLSLQRSPDPALGQEQEQHCRGWTL